MTLHIAKMYGNLNGNVATIVAVTLVEKENDPYPLCGEASGTGVLDLPSQETDEFCVPKEKAKFMWDASSLKIEFKKELGDLSRFTTADGGFDSGNARSA